jgi:2'-5' RNA ligase
LALDLDGPTKDNLSLVQRHIEDGRSRIRWVPPENLHVTLKFLGDIGDSQLADVCAAVEMAASSFVHPGPYDMLVKGLRAIPPEGRMLRMFWADVVEPDGWLGGLFEQLEITLEGLGVEREHRSYRPHITIGRVRGGNIKRLRERAEAYAEEPFGQVPVEYVSVYTSKLTPTGPIYAAALHAPLGLGA